MLGKADGSEHRSLTTIGQIESGAWGVLAVPGVLAAPGERSCPIAVSEVPGRRYCRTKLAQALWKVFGENLFGRGLDFLEQPPPRRDDALVTVSLSHLLSESYVARWDSKQEILLFLAERDAAE